MPVSVFRFNSHFHSFLKCSAPYYRKYRHHKLCLNKALRKFRFAYYTPDVISDSYPYLGKDLLCVSSYPVFVYNLFGLVAGVFRRSFNKNHLLKRFYLRIVYKISAVSLHSGNKLIGNAVKNKTLFFRNTRKVIVKCASVYYILCGFLDIGRIVNDSMGNYVADAAVKKMIEAGQAPKKSRVAILGLTFKEDCPDTRNSKVDDIIKRLDTYGIQPLVVDPWAEEGDAMKEYGVTLTKMEDLKDLDCIILAVAHKQFREMGLKQLKELFRAVPDEEKVLIDVKGLLKVKELEETDIKWWRL